VHPRSDLQQKLGRSEIERITHLTLSGFATQLRQHHLSAADVLTAYQSKVSSIT